MSYSKRNKYYNDLKSFINDLYGENLKIAILVDYLLRGHGPAHVVRSHVKELIQCGHTVTVFTLESDIKLPKDVKVIEIGCPSNNILKTIDQIIFPLKIIKNVKYINMLKCFDLIINHQHLLAWLALICKRKYNIPIIYYNHPVVSDKELFPSIFYRMFMKYNKFIYNLLIKQFDHIISISKYAQKILFESTGIQSLVIYNPVDVNVYKNVDNKIIKRKYRINDDCPIILFVGRLVPSKGIHLLIEAFSMVKKIIPNAILIIVGKQYFNEYVENLKRIATQFGVGDSIIFTGYVPDEELPYYYAACDVYVTASLHEGFDLPVAEAQAYGKPVVAFDVGAHKEVVKKGFLVEKGNVKEFANKIIDILTHKKYKKIKYFKYL